MRLYRSPAPLTVALALALSLSFGVTTHARVPSEDSAAAPFGAECRTSVQGSHVVAHCHNPYVETDRVQLHIECVRWWDLDTDSVPVDAGPATSVRLSGRCWKEIGSAWVSHQNRGS
ncbi:MULTISPECIES: hypothetical protein [Streptomyces]|uniref:Secreted protein n=1 Tax=Streptomyces cadmiisoli TaxID=2184053 RepID=A0A2Z4J5K5_9ACTN|nr:MULTISPECIES: hypothetical protein [Streptomyces]AWW40297.1 hypothetical protein DN051_29500 [Streptomyces cadmiisoli]